MSYYAFEGEPTDDSVRHSFHTVVVGVKVDVDEGIAAVVVALNNLVDVRTYASCQGHEHSEHERRGYVYVGWKTPRARAALELYAARHGYTLEQVSEEQQAAVLFLPEVQP